MTDTSKRIGTIENQNALPERQAATYIGMSRSFLAISRMEGQRGGRTPGPPWLKIGKRVLYLKDDLDAWLKAHRVGELR